jgi:hypothetical protein
LKVPRQEAIYTQEGVFYSQEDEYSQETMYNQEVEGNHSKTTYKQLEAKVRNYSTNVY